MNTISPGYVEVHQSGKLEAYEKALANLVAGC
jgi:hypothetical protein